MSKKELRYVKKVVKESDKPLTFNTENGKTNALEVAQLYCNELTEEIEPYVLENTPAVLTVGKRCMQQGLSFVWMAGSILTSLLRVARLLSLG